MLTADPLLIRVHQAFRAQRLADNPACYPAPPANRVYQPELPEPYDFMNPRPPRKEPRGPAPAARPMYLMQDQAPDARQWTVYDRATGVALGRVRGDAVWACGQIRLLVASQGARFEDVRVV